jgi:hypothetical protein
MFMLYFYRVESVNSTTIEMKNVIVMDGELYLKTIEKSSVLISAEDIEKNIKLQREAVAELCGEKWYNDELCVI